MLRDYPDILTPLRMSTAPPIARDRLVGLAKTKKSLVFCLERGQLPSGMKKEEVKKHLGRIIKVIDRLLDRDIFPWLAEGIGASDIQRERAASVVADRLCGATADPLIRNEQEKRQLKIIETFLRKRGYRRKPHPVSKQLIEMEPGTYSFRMPVIAGKKSSPVKIPVDVIIHPKKPFASKLPLLIEAKSAGDYTNVNKRRKEEAQKLHQLQLKYPKVQYILFLCGYFNPGYLGYSASEGLDWVWEHRVDDLLQYDL